MGQCTATPFALSPNGQANSIGSGAGERPSPHRREPVCACAEKGLLFGSTHLGNGYAFANAKDPDGSSVSISSWAHRQR